MAKQNFFLSWLVLLAIVVSACTQSTGARQVSASSDELSTASMQTNSEVDLKMNMRKLWEDHVTWTRNFIISSVDDLGDKDLVAQRLLKNQEDIGNAIKPYYGEDAGNNLTALLKDHILIAADIVGAAKAGDSNSVSEGQQRWTKNADDIATLLSNANPNWDKEDLLGMLQEHLDLTTKEAVSRLNKDYKAEIETYDEVHGQALMMADGLTEGIIRQFPDKFGR